MTHEQILEQIAQTLARIAQLDTDAQIAAARAAGTLCEYPQIPRPSYLGRFTLS